MNQTPLNTRLGGAGKFMELKNIPESIFDAIPDVIGVLDHDFGIIKFNTAGYEYFNLTHSEVVGKKYFELLGKRILFDPCSITKCYETKESTQGEYYFEKMDVWGDVITSPILDRSGDLVRAVVFFRDITRQKKQEMRLSMLERALNQSIDGIAIADMDGYNQFVNPAWAQAHGYTLEEMAGANLYSFHPEDQLREKVIPFFQKVMQYGSNQGESEHTKSDGSKFATYMMASLIEDDEQQPIGIVGTVRDISKLKAAEKELQKYRDHLENLVEARTAKFRKTNTELVSALSEIQELKDRLEVENINLRDEIKQEHNFEEIIGQSDPLKYVFYRIKEVAPTDSTVFIHGQTGTGKELVARAIHNNSSRKSRPLVKVDCSTLPANLIESELFGHEKGAFSGAHQQRKGRFEIADGTTLFLDEIGELALELQGKLLRVLEDGEFERLGSSKTIHTNVRVVAATNRNLAEEVERGAFREDLWYRLNVFSIKTPSLQDRVEDIPLLVEWFVTKFSRKLGKKINKIPQRTMNALQTHHWPGNIRELSNIIESAIISSHDETLRISNMPATGRQTSGERMMSMAQMEREYIIKAIETCKGQIEGKNSAASLLDLNPGTLRGRMRKYNIKRT